MLYPPGAVERAMHVHEIITRALGGQLTWIQAADIGRYNTLAIALAAEAAAILAFLQLVHDPIWSRG
jgi:hypothetical protein